MGKSFRIAGALMMAAVLAAFAETEYVNDLKPFDNAVEWDGFWTTTNHADVVVDSATGDLDGESGFSSGGIESSPGLMESFDSRFFTDFNATLGSFSSDRAGMFLIVR